MSGSYLKMKTLWQDHPSYASDASLQTKTCLSLMQDWDHNGAVNFLDCGPVVLKMYSHSDEGAC